MAYKWPSRYASMVLDYAVDYTRRLEGELISSVYSEVVEGDVQITEETHDGVSHTIWLSGGTAGTPATVLSRVTLTGYPARIMETHVVILTR